MQVGTLRKIRDQKSSEKFKQARTSWLHFERIMNFEIARKRRCVCVRGRGSVRTYTYLGDRECVCVFAGRSCTIKIQGLVWPTEPNSPSHEELKNEDLLDVHCTHTYTS